MNKFISFRKAAFLFLCPLFLHAGANTAPFYQGSAVYATDGSLVAVLGPFVGSSSEQEGRELATREALLCNKESQLAQRSSTLDARNI